MSDSINHCLIQIVQIVPSSQHGQYFAWVIVEGIMRKIRIVVPRVFYLNSKAPITEEFPGRRVNKILPHGRHSYNLIEVRLLFANLKLELQSIRICSQHERFLRSYLLVICIHCNRSTLMKINLGLKARNLLLILQIQKLRSAYSTRISAIVGHVINSNCLPWTLLLVISFSKFSGYEWYEGFFL